MKSLDESIAEIGSLIGDKSRALMLTSLMEGKSLTAGELALRANISPQTASNHLNKMMKASLVVCEVFGRHRYYKLSSSDVAAALEAIGIVTSSPKQELPHLNHLDKEICFARTCYDHLAGELGVRITNALLSKKMIVEKNHQYQVTNTGEKFFGQIEISTADLVGQRRHFAKPCLDWTERKYHLAGSLGAALLEYFVKNRLLIRSQKKSRIVVLTSKGELWFKDKLGF